MHIGKNPEFLKTINTKNAKYLVQMDSYKFKGSEGPFY